jgi:outer membrane murein-binding lipoprotein Lpp
MTVKVILAIIGAVMIGGFAFLGFQFNHLNGKLDTISSSLNAKIEANPQRLSEELRVMRAEMAAETSAIADSITANKQVQGPQPAPAPQPVGRC